jgi:acyl carrier protein
MISRKEILDRTREVIYECAPELEGRELNEDTVINTDTALDSMGFIYIMCKIEGEFQIKISERRWSKMKTLRDLLDEIEKAL